MACRKDGKGRVLRKGEHYRKTDGRYSYISTKTEVRSTTKANYLYTWDHFIRDTFGKKKIKDVKYSDVLFFYTDLITNKGLQVNTLESINTVLRPTFELAVDVLMKETLKNSYVASGNNLQKSRKDLPLYLSGNGATNEALIYI